MQEAHGVPSSVRGCHSARVGSYRVEGHVPADALKRFLQEHPDAAGISVPGMVVGPPGMEGAEPVPYEVVTFDDMTTDPAFWEGCKTCRNYEEVQARGERCCCEAMILRPERR